MDTFAPVALLNGIAADTEPNALLALAWSNYGHFTTLRVRGGAVQGLGLHFDRLRQGNAELFDAALDDAAVREWMRQASAASGGDCSLRVTLFSRRFDHRRPARELEVDVLVTASAPVVPALRPMRVRSCAWLRTLPHLKHLGTFPLHHHRRQAVLAGCDDVLFVDGEGADARVAEGSVWNLGFWDGEGVVWPQAPALRGTGERLLQEGLAGQGVAQQIRPVPMAELPRFRAAFAVNANGMRAIAAIDQAAYAETPELMRLLDAAAAQAAWESL
ncbi:MAG: aminotransferase class IV family protein [Xanthomonadales bacterium]|nr:aminotransferase class IV family protein [Xanthomonadales bacterium]MCA0198972.1 aminotransferase class IV family protein [Pseudomonadota bacterium]